MSDETPDIRLFAGIPPASQRLILDVYCTRRRFAPGATIVQRHDAGGEIFLVMSGRAYAKISAEIRVAFEPGEAFGEVCLVDEGYRSATVFADEQVEVAAMSRMAFEAFKRERPAEALVFLTNLASALAARLRRTNNLARAAERKAQELEAHREHSLWDRVKEALTRND
jgi:glutaminase